MKQCIKCGEGKENNNAKRPFSQIENPNSRLRARKFDVNDFNKKKRIQIKNKFLSRENSNTPMSLQTHLNSLQK